MDTLWARVATFVGSALLVAIRAPYGSRSRKVPVASRHKGLLETVLLTLAWLSFLITLLWAIRSPFRVADYPLHPIPFALGLLATAAGLWLFRLSHRDLGAFWSITLEVREGHRLVTEGVYRRIRHPMYTALLLIALGFALFIPNSIAGPSYLVAMLLLVALRLGPEERMIRERFGEEYVAYSARTKRLVPGVF